MSTKLIYLPVKVGYSSDASLT